VFRQFFLIPDTHGVEEWNTRDPIPFAHLVAVLRIVLTTGEVPHEVPPVHFSDLVFEEEFHVLSEGDRLLFIGDTDNLQIILLVLRIVVPDTREESLVFRVVVRLAGLLVVRHQIFALDRKVAAIFSHIRFCLTGQFKSGYLLRTFHHCISTLVHRLPITERVVAIVRSVKAFPIKNGPIPILFTVVVRQK